jgi:hypothetical protein
MMTPGEIEILIHCHCTPEPHPRLHAPAVQATIQSFLANDLIQRAESFDGYVTTARGAAHIEQLCRTPWPTQAWVNERGELIYPPAGAQ